MKKTLSILIVMALFVGAFSIAGAQTYGVSVHVDGKIVSFPDQRPYIDNNNRTLVPIRFIAEEMGAEVGWDESKQLVTIDKDSTEIKLTIGEKRANVNGEYKTFDTEAVIIGDRTMVPLRFISETLGTEVDWDGDNRIVYIWIDKEVPEGFEIINGFTVPKEPEAVIHGPDPGNNVEMSFSVFICKPIQPQISEIKTILESKFGKSEVINEAIAHASQKTDSFDEVERKYFYIADHRILVGSNGGNYYTNVLVYL